MRSGSSRLHPDSGARDPVSLLDKRSGTADCSDESWFAGQIPMIAYGSEGPMIEQDLLRRFTLYISVLYTK